MSGRIKNRQQPTNGLASAGDSVD